MHVRSCWNGSGNAMVAPGRVEMVVTVTPGLWNDESNQIINDECPLLTDVLSVSVVSVSRWKMRWVDIARMRTTKTTYRVI